MNKLIKEWEQHLWKDLSNFKCSHTEAFEWRELL